MGKKLIITEKPSVARDFARVLGVSGKGDGFIQNSEYVITWCVGHLVEMLYPESYDIKYKKWALEDLPFLPRDYKYGIIPNVAKQYQIVHDFLMSDDIETVYWAGDSGKEGQTIEENIRNFGGVRSGMNELRVWIDSQTDDEIRRGINEARPMADYANLGKSGIMRAIEDYALGINFSRVLSVKYGNMINAAAATSKYTAVAVGRVMTCVLGMIVRREREIRDFVETPFFRVFGRFMDMKLPAEWRSTEESAFYESPLLYRENGFKTMEGAGKLIDSLGNKAVIDSVEKTTTKKKPPLLFNLAELQAECAKLFKISPDETLAVAQSLYEKKLTTYPRTDARVLTKAVAGEINKNLYGLKNYAKTAKFVDRILNEKLYAGLAKTQYTDDSKVTDHYAIIPTGQTAEAAKLSPLEEKVFELIVRRFLSIFYPPAEYLNVKLVFRIGKESFFVSAKVLKVKGYMEISGVPRDASEKKTKAGDKKDSSEASDKTDASDDTEAEQEETFDKEALIALADSLKKGDEVDVSEFYTKEGKTSPPKRYTSGTIILAMENAGNLIEDEELRAQIKKSGIGTSATRAEIIKKLINIHYLNLNKKTQVLTPENLGEMIFEAVQMTVPSLLNPEMTANWEKGLDGIIRGEVDVEEYRSKLESFIAKETMSMIGIDIKQELGKRISNFAGKGAKGIGAHRPLGLVCPDCGGELTTTPFGFGCSNYSNAESPCKFSVGTISGLQLEEEDFRELIEKGRTKVLSGFSSKAGKKYRASLVLSKEDGQKAKISFDFSQNGPEIVKDALCPVCGGEICKTGFGYGCINYNRESKEGCKFAIGTIAGKDLSETQVKALLKNGSTAVIKGFKSKNGKKFDAKLGLEKGEDGSAKVVFLFENAAPEPIKDVACPVCGSKVMKTRFGCECEHYSRDKSVEGACTFSIGKVASKQLSEDEIKALIKDGITPKISEFVSKTGMFFEAKLTLAKDEQGKITGIKFVFDN